MTEQSVGPLTRGFLFADLRDYTAYAEGHGDRAAADLLDRYRSLVRAVVATSGGAEIRTEGDSFYVVFPSASAAVGAGLAIVARAVEATAAEPAQPIRVGVGIHAGEAEERDEGYVGTAVNMAARVCAEARSAEVLVTETVRSLVRTGGRYRFVPRGSHRLKGLAEPVALYRAEPLAEGVAVATPAAPLPVRPRSLAIAASAVALVAVVAVAVVAFVARPADPGADAGSGPTSAPASAPGGSFGPTPSPPGTAPFPNGPIEPGTYVTADFEPAIRLAFADDAWWKALELPNALVLASVDPQRSTLWWTSSGRLLVFFRPAIGYVGCSNDETTTIGANIKEDVVDYLTGNPGLDAESPKATSIAGLDGVLVRFRLGSPCGTKPTVKPLFQLWAGTPDETGYTFEHTLQAFAGPVYEVFVTEVNGEVLALWLAAPENQWEAFARTARSLLTTLEVTP